MWEVTDTATGESITSTLATTSPLQSKSKSKKRKFFAADENSEAEETLGWSQVSCPDSLFLGASDDGCGFLSLEEIDGVDVEYEGDEKTGRIIKFKKVERATKKQKPSTEKTAKNNKQKKSKINKTEASSEPKSEDKDTQNEPRRKEEVEEEPANNDNGEEWDKVDVDISAWDPYQLARPIIRALKKLNFTTPTPIQEKALPMGMAGRDVVGAAETGSGKTLAFGLPIIHHIAQNPPPSQNSLVALVLTPTRELAIQVKDHFTAIAQFTSAHIMTLVGGMAPQKQRRLLARGPNVIIGTPGRVWEMLSENDEYLGLVKRIQFLVIDEADRMLETGHFRELQNILQVLSRKRTDTNEWPEHMQNEENKEITEDISPRQTFIFSATMTRSLTMEYRRRKNDNANETDKLKELMDRIEFSDPEPAFIDLTTSTAVASNLVEARVDCLQKDKDAYMYYFIKRYPGRTLVFVNSIDSIRRLVPVFRLLGVEVLSLHAQMQQRQRLKNLDRFKANENAILVASDVAARGLDIPLVEHVLHYQLPRTGEIYVHRSGRTARAQREGISLMLNSPEEIGQYKKICNALNRENGYPEFPVDRGILTKMKEHISLARKIDEAEHRMQKTNYEDNWLRKSADEMGIILDDDMFQGKASDNEQRDNKKHQVKQWKAQLKSMLAQPLMPRGTSTRYLSGGIISDLAERLMDKERNPLLPTEVTSKAVEDVKTKAKQPKRRF
ncbi:uncharacterized protein VTP21DRAFT_1431 [Calcarisporiella thermophila]|uniref:uncharacterized protein n=1 Tax=Calcarisporiella thermophila TaxID=911321 RepID=UPI003743513B